MCSGSFKTYYVQTLSLQIINLIYIQACVNCLYESRSKSYKPHLDSGLVWFLVWLGFWFGLVSGLA